MFPTEISRSQKSCGLSEKGNFDPQEELVALVEVLVKEARYKEIGQELLIMFSHFETEIADSAQTEHCTTFHCPSVRHRRDISHYSHI